MEVRDSNYQPQVDLTGGPPSSVTALIQNITSSMSVFGYTDEYDPLKPNDYEKLKEQQRRDKDSEPHRTDESEKKHNLYDDDDDDEDEEEKEYREAPKRKGNVFAPPPSLIEEDKRAMELNQSENRDDFSTNADEDMETESSAPTPSFSSTKGY